MNERKPGWYWVRIDDEWGCMCWTGKTWNVMDEHMDDSFFDEIGSRMPKPDEPWQCVPKNMTPDRLQRAFNETRYDEGYGSQADVWAALLALSPKP